jgi:hypothetical protein
VLDLTLSKETAPNLSQGFSPAPEPIPQPVDPYSGSLEPADDPMPSDISGFWFSDGPQPSNSVFLFAGSCVFGMAQSKSSCLFSHKHECILSLEQPETGGALFVSGSFFDEDGRLIAELSSNGFNVALPLCQSA